MQEAIEAAAAQWNARDVTTIPLLVNRAALRLENGALTGLDAELRRLRREFPGIFFQWSTPANRGSLFRKRLWRK